MDLNSLVFGGVALLPLIFGLVEFAKKLGLSGKVLTGVSAGIGVVFGVAAQLATMYPVLQPWFAVVAMGLLTGMAASGIYDFVAARAPRAQ